MKVYRKTNKYSGDPGDGTTFKVFINLTQDEAAHLRTQYGFNTHYDLFDESLADDVVARIYDLADPGFPGCAGPGRPWVSRPVMILDLRHRRVVVKQRSGLDV